MIQFYSPLGSHVSYIETVAMLACCTQKPTNIMQFCRLSRQKLVEVSFVILQQTSKLMLLFMLLPVLYQNWYFEFCEHNSFFLYILYRIIHSIYTVFSVCTEYTQFVASKFEFGRHNLCRTILHSQCCLKVKSCVDLLQQSFFELFAAVN